MVSTQQIGSLSTDFSTTTGLPKAVAQNIIERSIGEPSWVFPINSSGFPLYTQSSSGSNTVACAATSRTSAGTTAIATVTAGQRWRITGFWLSHAINSTAATTYAQITLNGNVALEVVSSTAAGDLGNPNNMSMTFPLDCAYVLNAGEVANLVVTNGCVRTAGGIMYVVETV